MQTDLNRRQVEWDANMPFVFTAVRDLVASAYREELQPITVAVDWVQGALTVAGILDPSPLCDAINGVIHLIRGNNVEAAWSFVSMLPYAGDAVGKGARFLGRVGETLKGASHAAGATSKAADLCLIGRMAAKIGLGKVARAIGLACFTEDTQVVVGVNNDGSYVTRNIQDIQVGDWVLTRDENDPNAPLVRRQVLQTFAHEVQALRTLSFQDASGNVETIVTTDEHPFFVLNVGWVAAKDLKPGHAVLTPDGETSLVVSNVAQLLDQPVTVYNLEVADGHTYFVEDGHGDKTPVWVHNKCAATIALRNAANQITHIFAVVSRATLHAGTAASNAARKLVQKGDDAGHIIGRLLGGCGRDLNNIISQNRRINRGKYRVFEGDVARFVAENGTTVINVRLLYNGGTRPIKILYEAIATNGKRLFKSFNN